MFLAKQGHAIEPARLVTMDVRQDHRRGAVVGSKNIGIRGLGKWTCCFESRDILNGPVAPRRAPYLELLNRLCQNTITATETVKNSPTK